MGRDCVAKWLKKRVAPRVTYSVHVCFLHDSEELCFTDFPISVFICLVYHLLYREGGRGGGRRRGGRKEKRWEGWEKGE